MEAVKMEKTLIAVPQTIDGLQSTCLLCHSSSLKNLQDFFNVGGRKIENWIKQLPFSIVKFDDQFEFMNINTKKELEKATL
jgi:molybdopterin-guanine dinucleotide biosynthesis protein A